MVLNLVHDQLFHCQGVLDLSKSVVIFGVPNSSSVQADNRKRDIFILGKVPRDGFHDTAITTVIKYSINCTEQRKKTSLHYNGSNSFLFAHGIKIYQFKEKDSKISSYYLCSGYISKDFTVDNMKKTGLNVYVYNFSVDYDIIVVMTFWIFISI